LNQECDVLWVSRDAEVVIAPELGDIGKGNRQCAIANLYEPSIEEGEPGNPVVIENSVKYFIPAALEFIEREVFRILGRAHRPRIRQSFIETSPCRGWGVAAQDDRSMGSR